MTARIVLSCDGHRNGEGCRGALPTRWRAEHRARSQARAAGWRPVPGIGDVCPSGGHDEDQPHERSP